MNHAGQAPRPAPEVLEVIKELRTFVSGVERYMAEMSHLHTMHRTDLAALGLIMDRKASSPKELSESLALSPPAVSAMLARLEQAGHIERSPMPGNRRSVHIDVTESALAVGGSMFGLLGRHMRPVLEGRDPAQLAALAQLMSELTAATNAARDHAAQTLPEQ